MYTKSSLFPQLNFTPFVYNSLFVQLYPSTWPALVQKRGLTGAMAVVIILSQRTITGETFVYCIQNRHLFPPLDLALFSQIVCLNQPRSVDHDAQ
jgi:hypothetical protein